jgi:hypothetical protein
MRRPHNENDAAMSRREDGTLPAPVQVTRSLVVFQGDGVGIARWLRPGFRHCYAVMLVDGYWIALDGRGGLPDIRVVAGEGFDLADFYRDHGFTVIEMEAPRHRSRVPFVARTCVGAVKAMIGIKSWALTPRQLHLRLINRRN